MNKEFNEETKATAEESAESEYIYKQVIKEKQQTRAWSVAALVLSALSLLLCYFSWVGLILGLLSVGAAAISRKHLGYFDKLSIVALIIAIFGVVFSLTGIIFADFIATLFA